MENCSNGTLNCSHLGEGQGLDGPVFGVFSLLMALLNLFHCVLTVLTITALCTAQPMSKQLRIFLINISVGVLVMGGTFLTFTLVSVTLVFTEIGLPPLLLCRLLTWLLALGGFVRPLNVSAYSVAVLVIVRFGKKDWRTLYSGVSIAILWLVVMASDTIFLMPSVTVVQYLEGVACYIDSVASFTEVGIVFSVIQLAFGNVVPLVVSAAIPIHCLHYIRKHCITVDMRYKKVVSRLALFLVTGNTVNLAGNLLIIV